MQTGRIKAWNDDRGFGFIQSAELSKDVFVHISALKGMARKPRVGDTIHFQVEHQDNGKLKAVRCSIQGVAKIEPMPHRPRSKIRNKRTSWIRRLLPAAVVIAAFFGYQKLETSSGAIPEAQSIISLFDVETSADSTRFSCSGKTHCSQMTSCEEATFYLNNCTGTNMDGDNDGVLCERQLCNRW